MGIPSRATKAVREDLDGIDLRTLPYALRSHVAVTALAVSLLRRGGAADLMQSILHALEIDPVSIDVDTSAPLHRVAVEFVTAVVAVVAGARLTEDKAQTLGTAYGDALRAAFEPNPSIGGCGWGSVSACL